MTKLTYVDRPELLEIFTDRVGTAEFSGHTIRLEFSVSRPERSGSPSGTPQDPPRQVVPVARLVLTVDAALSLHQGLTGMLRLLSQQGLIESFPQSSGPSTKQ